MSGDSKRLVSQSYIFVKENILLDPCGTFLFRTNATFALNSCADCFSRDYGFIGNTKGCS